MFRNFFLTFNLWKMIASDGGRAAGGGRGGRGGRGGGGGGWRNRAFSQY